MQGFEKPEKEDPVLYDNGEIKNCDIEVLEQEMISFFNI